jgi:hypothetical protein
MRGFENGLWAAHLREDRALRGVAFHWVTGGSIEPLLKVFGTVSSGARVGRINLDVDDWKAFDRAAPAFDEVFAQWVEGAATRPRPRRTRRRR